jgi:hypothetical protein
MVFDDAVLPVVRRRLVETSRFSVQTRVRRSMLRCIGPVEAERESEAQIFGQDSEDRTGRI